MSEAACPVRKGDLVAGKYRVLRLLGAGGMGVVVAATQIELDRPVALKFLLAHVAGRPELATRFAREARAAAKLESEHVTRVLDVGALDTGEPFIVMEYLEGVDLAHVLQKNGPLPCELVVRYVLEACEGVAEAHAHGIVHRDLKPANLFLAKRMSGAPVIKVLDFGISKFIGTENEHVTSSSSLLGSPTYMSPEQLLSPRDVDARSDVWALGVILYELVTGVRPFNAEHIPELVAAILYSPYPALEALLPDVPTGFSAAVRRCLEKASQDRYPTVAALARAIGPFGPPSSRPSVERIVHMLGETADIPASLAPAVPVRSDTIANAKVSDDNPPAPHSDISVPTMPSPQTLRGARHASGLAESVAGASRSIRRRAPSHHWSSFRWLALLLGVSGLATWAALGPRMGSWISRKDETHSPRVPPFTSDPVPPPSDPVRPQMVQPSAAPSSGPPPPLVASGPGFQPPPSPVAAAAPGSATTSSDGAGVPVAPTAVASSRPATHPASHPPRAQTSSTSSRSIAAGSAMAASTTPAPSCSVESYVDPSDSEVHFRKVCR